MSVFASKKLARSTHNQFPASLNAAPLLLPADGTALRREIDRWLHERDLVPRIVGEFDDTALLKAFGEAGHGLFFAPSVLEREFLRSHGIVCVGRVPEVRERFFAITVARRLEHPAAVEITRVAREHMFGEE